MAREESEGAVSRAKAWLQKPAPGDGKKSMGPVLTRLGWLSMLLPLLAVLLVGVSLLVF